MQKDKNSRVGVLGRVASESRYLNYEGVRHALV
jgi:hypothetical protein